MPWYHPPFAAARLPQSSSTCHPPRQQCLCLPALSCLAHRKSTNRKPTQLTLLSGTSPFSQAPEGGTRCSEGTEDSRAGQEVEAYCCIWQSAANGVVSCTLLMERKAQADLR